jgi:hypothetical protein
MGTYQIAYANYKCEGVKISTNKKFLKSEEDKKRGYVLIPVIEYSSNPRTKRFKFAIQKCTNVETGEVLWDKT